MWSVCWLVLQQLIFVLDFVHFFCFFFSSEQDPLWKRCLLFFLIVRRLTWSHASFGFVDVIYAGCCLVLDSRYSHSRRSLLLCTKCFFSTESTESYFVCFIYIYVFSHFTLATLYQQRISVGLFNPIQDFHSNHFRIFVILGLAELEMIIICSWNSRIPTFCSILDFLCICYHCHIRGT